MAAPSAHAQLRLDMVIRPPRQDQSITANKPTPLPDASAAKATDPTDPANPDAAAELKAEPAEPAGPLVLHFKKDQRADLVLRDFLKANKMTLDWRYAFHLILDEEAHFEATDMRELLTKALSALGLRATLDGGRTLIVEQRI